MKPKDNILSSKTALTIDNLRNTEYLFPYLTESCELTIECSRRDYSASAIARAVEDADAHLMNLNVTAAEPSAGTIYVQLRISHRNAGCVARSLERYGYGVVDIHSGFDADTELTAMRIDELLAQIEI